MSGTSLIPFAGSLVNFEDPTKKQKLEQLKQMHEELKNNMEELDRLTDKVQKIVVPPNRDKDIEIAHVQAELQDVQTEMQRLAAAKHRRENPQAHKAPPQDEASKPPSKIEKLCKKLFKKISTKTHPDRTPNKEFHGLYQLALRYREIWDLKGLQSIWNQVKDGPSKRHNKTIDELLEENAESYRLSIEEEIVQMEAEVRELARKRQEINNSEFIRVIWAYQQHGDQFAIEFYAKVLDATLKHYTRHLQQLRATLELMIREQGEGTMPQRYSDVINRAKREQQRHKEEQRRKQTVQDLFDKADLNFEE